MLFFWCLVHISFQIHISTVLSTRCCPPLDQSSFSFSSLQQCARRVSCVVVANRQTLACHLIFLKRALLCICTLQNLHISQRARCICTLENFIFLNVHYAFSHLKFYIFPMCTMYFNTGKVHIFQLARCIFTLEKFVFPTCTPWSHTSYFSDTRFAFAQLKILCFSNMYRVIPYFT